MSRTLSFPVSGPLTEPTYLVELGFRQTLWLSNGKQETWNGRVWSEAAMRVSSIEVDARGSQSLSLTFANEDRIMSSLVLNDGARDRRVRVWIAYGDPAVQAPILLADGEMDGAGIGQEVTISVISRSSAYGSTPRLICAPPLFNHLPASGTRLVWGNVTYTLESR